MLPSPPAQRGCVVGCVLRRPRTGWATCLLQRQGCPRVLRTSGATCEGPAQPPFRMPCGRVPTACLAEPGGEAGPVWASSPAGLQHVCPWSPRHSLAGPRWLSSLNSCRESIGQCPWLSCCWGAHGCCLVTARTLSRHWGGKKPCAGTRSRGSPTGCGACGGPGGAAGSPLAASGLVCSSGGPGPQSFLYHLPFPSVLVPLAASLGRRQLVPSGGWRN